MTATHKQNSTTRMAPVLYLLWSWATGTGSWPSPSAWARSPGSGRSRPGHRWPALAEIKAAKKRFGLPENAAVVSCYEAGRDGFWLHRFLLSQGFENLVVDSASIEVNRRKRRAKSDRLDAVKLVEMLIRWCNGEQKVWSVVRVPPWPRRGSAASCTAS